MTLGGQAQSSRSALGATTTEGSTVPGPSQGNGNASDAERRTLWNDLLFQFARDGKVLTGKEGWLFLDNDRNEFLKQYAGELKPSPELLEVWRQILETRRARIEELGARYYFLVAPEGHTVYPEYLPDEVVAADDRTVFQLMRHLSASKSPMKLIYPLEDLIAEKSRWQVHRPRDSHWSDQGAYVAYRRLIREIAKEVPVHEVTEEELEFFEAEVASDLAFKLDADPGTMQCARYVYSRARLLSDNQIALLGAKVVTECPQAPPTKCIVFGDSAMYGLMTFLAQSFGRLVLALTSAVDYDLIRQERPDVVVTQMVERYLIEVSDDTVAPSIEELEAEEAPRGPGRPRIPNWDPLPEDLPVDAVVPPIETVEAIRARMMCGGRREDATFVSLLAYAGLSGAEALRLSWPQLQDGTLAVEPPYASLREEDDPRLRERSVPLLDPLAEDLESWHADCGNPDSGYVFPNLRRRDWEKWMRRVYLPATGKRGEFRPGPELLSRTFVALLIRGGASPSEVARQMGNTRSEIANGFYYLWDQRPLTAPPEDISGLIRESRAASMARERSVKHRVLALTRSWRVRRLPKGPGWDSLPKESVILPPETVERIRARLIASGQHEAATFVSVMAYAGLRQGEATGLKWRQIEDSNLVIEAVPIGHASDDEWKLRERSISLAEPLAEDLAKWRAESGNPERGYVFPDLRQLDWQEWVSSTYSRAAKHAAKTARRPAVLYHTFVALLIAEGAFLEDVARQAGLSKQDTIGQYSRLFEDARADTPVSAAEQIRAARALVFRSTS